MSKHEHYEPQEHSAEHHQHASHQHGQDQGSDQQVSESLHSEPQGPLFKNRKLVVALFIFGAIITFALNVYYRVSLLQFFGFYEPDGFYHFSVVRAAVNNNLIIPHYLGISGWPHAAPVNEPFGLYLTTLIPYSLLHGFGIDYYTIMRYIPLLFAILDAIGAYLLARYISRDKFFGLLVLLFVALSMGDAARTSATIYRGDTFASIYLIIALVFIVKIFKRDDTAPFNAGPIKMGMLNIGPIKIDSVRLIYSVVAAVSLALCNLVWNGAAFATATVIFSLILLLASGFVFDKEKTLENSGYVILCLFLWLIIVNMFMKLQFIRPGQTFTGSDFLFLLGIMFAMWALAYLLTKKKTYVMSMMGSIFRMNSMLFRLMLAVAASVLVFAVIYLVIPATVQSIFVTNGFIITENFGATIQELQPPTSDFLFASFGYSLAMTPMSIVMWASTLPTSSALWISILVFLVLFLVFVSAALPFLVSLKGRFEGVQFLAIAASFILAALVISIILFLSVSNPHADAFKTVFIFWIVLVISFVPFFYMQVYDSGESFISGNARLRFDINEGLVVIMAYFALTAYLQMHAIRFNSLVSIPLAILSAYTVYWLIAYFRSQNTSKVLHYASLQIMFAVFGLGVAVQFFAAAVPILRSTRTAYIAASVFSVSIVVLLEIFVLLRERLFRLLAGIGLIALAAVFIYAQHIALTVFPALYIFVAFLLISVILIVAIDYMKGINLWYLLIMSFIIYILVHYDMIYSNNLSQADAINPTFITALNWLKSNSPSNSVVLTLWPDGSLVEGVANRTSVTDSVGSQNGTKALPFANWILNSNPEPRFLLNRTTAGRPDYLLVRSTWLFETTGIFIESGLNGSSESSFGYIPLSSFAERSNNTDGLIQLQGSSGLRVVIDLPGPGTNRSIGAYTTINQSVLHFAAAAFFDSSNANFSLYSISNQANITNETVLVTYSDVRHPGAFLNITGAQIVAPGLGNSNMFKFLFFCSASSCVWDNKIARLQMVYYNQDTKIFKIIYNKTVSA